MSLPARSRALLALLVLPVIALSACARNGSSTATASVSASPTGVP